MTSFDPLADLPLGTTVLEASAGTGKSWSTTTLAVRYLAEGLADIDSLMVVTFSRVATQHLRELIRRRLRDALAALAGPPGDDALDAALREGGLDASRARRDRLADAMTDFDRATIMTTHEFCQGMLRGLGVLAGTEAPANFVEDLGPLIDEVAQDTYLRRYAFDESVPKLPWLTPTRGPSGARTLAREAMSHPEAVLAPGWAHGAAGERVEFAAAVRSGVTQRKLRTGAYTFDDMLTRLRDALIDPETGPAAQQRLRERYRVVLVDEFQDTDPIQWDILRMAFDGYSTLVLIGDPKQAIYTFRGADVNAYAAAVASSRRPTATLTTNYRSDAAVVTAVTGLFKGISLGPGIDAPEVTAHVQQRRLVVPDGDAWAPPVRIRTHVAEESLDAPEARRRIDADLTLEVARLLRGEARLRTASGERPVRPEDIAILVRTNRRGRAIVQALARAGIPATFSGAESIFASTAAQQWNTLLTGLTQHRAASLRAAMLTPFVGARFVDLVGNEDAVASWSGQLRAWSRVLHRDGVAALFGSILASPGVSQRIMSLPEGERLMTDYRHVAEILNDEALSNHWGPLELATWLREAVAASEPDSGRVRRLETDAQTVQVMSIHRSKGLEFPVVLLPQAADEWVPTKDDGHTLTLHEGEQRLLDVGGATSPGRSERFAKARREDGEDSLRTLYVAMTRGESQVTCWWVDTGRVTSGSPLHRLLFAARVPGQVVDPQERYPGDPEARVESPENLSWLGSIDVEVQRFENQHPKSKHLHGPTPAPLAVRGWNRRIDRSWRRTSYSALTTNVHDFGPERFLADEPEAAAIAGATALLDAPSPMAELPGGTAFGTFVHAILEQFAGGDDPMAELRDLAAGLLRRFPLDDVTPAAAASALLPTVQASLGRLTGGRSLLAMPDRLRELDFELPMGGVGRPATIQDVADLLAAHLPEDHPLASYPARLREVDDATLLGFLTGSIDAVLRVPDPERYVVVDYKTNRLGVGTPVLGHYTPESMAEAMMASHYPLQALLYAVALHRFLTARLEGYEPRTHLGGVLYLFVRGLGGPGDDALTGVFEWEPTPALVIALSHLLAGVPDA